MTSQIPTVSVDDLRAFHAKHFPHAPTPQQYLHGVAQEPLEEEYQEEDDGLGYYPDGTKRTLTDEQIAMFRHSEIQAILRKRRRRRDEGEPSEEGEAVSTHSLAASPATGTSPDAVHQTTSNDHATLTAGGAADKVESGRIEKPKTQQWATSSARTKAANKRHNQKYRRKKKEERKRQEQEQKDALKKKSHEDDESDEWDPWHQANGPDVQKDDAVDLDY